MKDLTHYFLAPPKTTDAKGPDSIFDKNNHESETVGAKTSVEQAENDSNKNSISLSDNNSSKYPETKVINDTSTINKKRSKKKKKARKPTDPGIKNITELMSSNLSIVSPNTTVIGVNCPDSMECAKEKECIVEVDGSKVSKKENDGIVCKTRSKPKHSVGLTKHKVKIKMTSEAPETSEVVSELCVNVKIAEKNIACQENVEIVDKTSKPKHVGRTKNHKLTDVHQTTKTTSGLCKDALNAVEKDVASQENKVNTKKLDAFQFLMEQRNKSIGTNSPGKDPSSDHDLTEEQINKKENLAVRKNLFENWAERKGRTKRQREEDEVEQTIHRKLEKRAKKLKNMLHIKDDSIKSISKSLRKKKRRRLKIVESDSDSVNDEIKVVAESKQHLEDNIIEYQDLTKSDALDVSVNGEGSKTMLNGTCEGQEADNKPDALPKKDSKPRNSLVNFLGTVEPSKKSEAVVNIVDDESKSVDEKIIKIKMFPNNSTKKRRKSNLSLNKTKSNDLTAANEEIKQVTDEAEIIIKEKIVFIEEPVGKEKSLSNRKTIVNVVSDHDSPPMRKSKRHKHKKIHIDESSQEGDITLQKAKKHKHEKNCIDESNQEADLTLRSLKQWKMKIKVVDDTITTNEDYNDEKIELREKKSKNCKENIVLSSDSDYEPEQKSKDTKNQSKLVKVAPIFLKAAPKPKINPEVLEARRQFLLSSIPSSIRKELERQHSIEEIEFDVFPEISHVQQKSSSETLWDLSPADLKLEKFLPLKINKSELVCENLTHKNTVSSEFVIENKKVTKFKGLLKQIKKNNPNYPVYKSFRLIFENSGYKKPIKKNSPEKRPTPKRRGRKKKENLDKSVEIIEDPPKPELESSNFNLWTEKYKPKTSDDILGNPTSIAALKKYLEAWLQFSQEINSKSKRKRQDSDSESEFCSTDCDSRDSTRLPGNMLILEGPPGSGKTSSVYAVCNELGFSVLELNASSKRTGKRLMQELQEATQSHQVRKEETHSLSSFLQTDKSTNQTKSSEPQTKQRMCVLFVEDIDVVFEQDDGFINALSQLAITSKRPIILSTTDDTSVYAQKFITQYGVISFSPLSAYTLATWLQIVCLIEGLFVRQESIGVLLEYNKGDIRKTLLELQFWVQSGGQINRSELQFSLASQSCSTGDNLETIQDDSDASWIVDDGEGDMQYFHHSNCINSFEVFKLNSRYTIPYPINLSLLWWNIPNILSQQNISLDRLNKFNIEDSGAARKLKCLSSTKNRFKDKMKLKTLSNLLDSMALTDVMFRKVDVSSDLEFSIVNFNGRVKDSLELGERTANANPDLDLVEDLTHYLVNGYVEEYLEVEEKSLKYNMAAPDSSERRWRAKHHMCETVFQEALPGISTIERKAVATDYMPTLRNIARSEQDRAANNTKRGNRFRNYLRCVGVNCGDSTCKLACKILKS